MAETNKISFETMESNVKIIHECNVQCGERLWLFQSVLSKIQCKHKRKGMNIKGKHIGRLQKT